MSRDPLSPPLSPARAAGLLALFYLLQLVTAVAVGTAAGLSFALQDLALGPGSRLELARFAGPLGSLVGFGFAGLATAWLARRHRWDGGQGAPWEASSWEIPIDRGLAYLALGIAFGAVYLSFVRAGALSSAAMSPAAAGSDGWPRIAWVFLALVLAPWIEEFVFRGVLWGSLASRCGAICASIIVAVVFTAAHLPETIGFPPATMAIAGLAVLLSFARWRSGGLLAPVAVHSGYNVMIVLAALSQQGL